MTNSKWMIRNGTDGITYLGNTSQVYVDSTAFKAGNVIVSGNLSTNNKTGKDDQQVGVYINNAGNIHLTGDTNSGSGIYFYFNKSSQITSYIQEESSETLKLSNNVKVNGTLSVGGAISASYISTGEGGLTAKTKRNVSGGEGWAYNGLRFIGNDDSVISQIGVHGSAATYSYMYLGNGSYNSNTNVKIYANGNLVTGGTITSLSNIYARVASGEARIQADNNNNNKIYLYANSDGHVGIQASAANGTVMNILTRANNSDYMEMGANLVNKSTYSNTASNAANMFINSSGTYCRSTASSKRYKHDIEPLVDYCNVLNIPVVSYKYNKDYLSSSDRRYDIDIPGFIAEDVEKYYPIATEYNNDGDVEDWNVRMIVPPMLAVEQKHDKQIQLLIKENKELKQKLDYILSKIS